MISACAPESGGGKGKTLNFFIFNEPSGVIAEIADSCSQSSGGSYNIQFEFLPAQADQQREQLVRRLGAEDSNIDLMGMDVIWTGEFANAGWVEEWTGEDAQAVTDGVFESIVDNAQFEDKLWAAPLWSNTQLLWFRKDRVPQPPNTWEQMFQQGKQIGKNGKIEVQANRYEGLTVWFNAMVESAGTSVVKPDNAQEVALDPAKTEKALGLMVELANSELADPAFSTSTEDSARLAFEEGSASFMLNYPFVFPSAKQNAPEVFKQLGQTQYPRVDPDRPSKPPLGGINVGISSFSKNKEEAFAAVKCMVQPQNQIKNATQSGLPPVNENLYSDPGVKQAYPGFAQDIKEAIKNAAPRPVAVAYQDVTLAIQRSIHPLSDISSAEPGSEQFDQDIADAVEKLRENVQDALNVEGLL